MADEADVAPATDTLPEENATTTTPGATPDTGVDVAKLQEQLTTLTKRYTDIQSFDTKVSQENAMLKAKLELLESQERRGVSDATVEREQAAFDENWRKQLEENPGKAVDFFRGTARELQTSIKDEVSKAIESMKAELRETRESLNPEYQQHRETVDRLIEKYKISRDAAIAIAKEMKPAPPATPTRAALPGRTAGARVTGDEPETERVQAPPGMEHVMSLLGLDQKAQARVLTQKKG